MVEKFIVHGEFVWGAFLEIIYLGEEYAFSECGAGTKLIYLIDCLVDGRGCYFRRLVESLHS